MKVYPSRSFPNHIEIGSEHIHGISEALYLNEEFLIRALAIHHESNGDILYVPCLNDLSRCIAVLED